MSCSASPASSASASPRGARSPAASCPATRDNTAPAGSGRVRSAAPRLTDKTFSLLDALRRTADELGAPVAAVALAWVRQQSDVTSTIIGARTVEQLESNLSSLEVTIPDQQLAELDKHTEPQLEFPADILTAMERDN